MAIFRKIHVSFWGDPFVESLTPEQKFFYLYLLTNKSTTQCGIYEATIRQMCFDTGYNEETVKKLLKYFIDQDKVRYSLSSKELAIKNWPKYNDSASPKVKACIKRELKTVKDRVLIQYLYSISTELYSMDTHSQEEEEQEREEEQESQFSAFAKQLKSDRLFIEQTCQMWAMTEQQFGDMIQGFMMAQQGIGKVWKDYHDCKSNFFSWGKKDNRYLKFKPKKREAVQ